MDSILSTDLISTGRVKINDNFDSLPELIQSYIDNLDWQQSVLSRVQITAPTASEGDRYIVGEVVDTEDPWYGHDYEVATKTESGWSFVTPNVGYCVTVEDENLEYVWAVTDEWVSRAYATWHNHLGGMDGGDAELEEYYHLTSDTYLGLASVTEIDPAVVDSDARLSDTRDPNAHSHTESDISDFGSYSTTDHDHDLAYSAIGHTHSYAASDHDQSHILGGADVIDGDKLEISWNPTNSTPDSVPDYSDNLDHLTSHLKGIDVAIGIRLTSDNVLLEQITTPESVAEGYTQIYAKSDGKVYRMGHDGEEEEIGTGGGSVIDGTAGENLAAYDVVYASAGEYFKAQADNTEVEADAVGIVTEALGITNAATGEITLGGLVTNAGWSWTPGAQLYLSGTYGGISETEPTTVGDYVKPLGFAVSATQIFFNPQAGWVVGGVTDHASAHITSGSDEIDGDKLDIDWNPSNYTPATVESYADSVDNLTAHLKGIDTAIGSVSVSDEVVQDIVGAMVSSNTETGIALTYDDTVGKLNAAVTYGTSANTACEGNDSRLSDMRTPPDDSVTLAKMAHGTQGGLIYYGASGVPTELAAGTSGYYLKTQGASNNPVWAAVSSSMPSKAIQQVVYASRSTTFSTTSESPTAVTSLSVAITPTSSSSKILIIFSGGLYRSAAGPADAEAYIYRGASSIHKLVSIAAYETTLLNGTYAFVDSPATTSSTKYAIYAKGGTSTSGNTTMYVGGNYNGSANTFIIVAEILP